MGHPDARLRLLLDLYNATYEVRSGGARFALRVARLDCTLEEVQAEAAWIRALAKETAVVVGEPVGLEWVDGRVCLLTRWVPGVLRKKRVSPAAMEAMGAVMAQLHDHGEQWAPPKGWSRPRLGVLWHGRPSPVPALTGRDAEVIAACAERVERTLVALAEEPGFVLHADLHQGNVRFASGQRVGVFDFDDCGVGPPVMDVAISWYYRRAHPNREALFRGFRTGYERHRPWAFDPTVLEALQVWRMLTLCAVLHVHPNATLRGYVKPLLPGWVAHGEAWLATQRS